MTNLSSPLMDHTTMQITSRAFLFVTLLWFSEIAIAEMAILGESLKKQYRFEGAAAGVDYQTGETADSFSMICDMGQAIPDSKKEGDWYINKPVSSLKLELRARIVSKRFNNAIVPHGFVVITKNGEVLKVFKPLGDYNNGRWEGDVFSVWGTGPDIAVWSERLGESGYAKFDLLSGNGFYYKSLSRVEPDYFLSNCRRIKKIGLPVYKTKFDAWKE